jgi:hypothetical protein
MRFPSTPSHRQILLLEEAEANSRPSGEEAMKMIEEECPLTTDRFGGYRASS